MVETLLKVFPLLLASTLSPGLLALSVVLLSKKDGFKQTLAFLVGSVITSVAIIVIGLSLGETIKDLTGTKIIDNIVDLVLSGVFLYFGIITLVKNDNENKTKFNDKKNSIWLWMGLGFILSITNFDAVIFDITAAKEVGQAQISTIDKTIILVIESIFFNLPILLPAVLYAVAPATAKKILDPVNVFLTKYGKYIVSVIFLGFGIYLAYKGLQGII
mgnify:CR=1 FL=1